MEQMSDIRNIQTPLSLGLNGSHANRVLWRQPRFRFTSTPRPTRVAATFQLESSYLDESFAESPIFPAHQSKVNLVFGRRQSLESDRLSGILTSMAKIELCDNNNDSAQEDLQKRTKDIRVKKNCRGDSSSSTDVQEKFKKQLNKNKKKKETSPKKRSPKAHKIGLKKNAPEVAAKKVSGSSKVVSSIATAKKKSPKNKSPKTYKTCPTKKVVRSSNATKQAKDPSKAEHVTEKLENHSTNESAHHGTKHSELKVSRCAKSPKLRTAERALIKQRREEMRKEKQKLLEINKQKELEEQRRREEEKMLKIRQQTQFKAHPIRKYAPLPNVKKRALTDPATPNLSKRRRIESSSQCHSHTSHSKT